MLSEKELQQQIRATAELLNLDEYVIEKDYYLTKAIAIVINVKNINYRLIFQGGTSLAKAHGIINRMSEDIDFRIELTNHNIASKEQKKRLLKEFRKAIIAELRNNNFKINDDDILIANEGRFMSIKATYPSKFTNIKHIKPFIALDFFLGNIRTTPETKSISTLIKKTLKDKVNHPITEVKCISILETAAEKWVALTRRVASIAHGEHYNDPSLVRHLYDLYHIYKSGFINNHNLSMLAYDIIEHDKIMFKNHNTVYSQDPISEIKRVLVELETNDIWPEYWGEFIDAMVFDKNELSYNEAIKLFLDISHNILNSKE